MLLLEFDACVLMLLVLCGGGFWWFALYWCCWRVRWRLVGLVAFTLWLYVACNGLLSVWVGCESDL